MYGRGTWRRRRDSCPGESGAYAVVASTIDPQLGAPWLAHLLVGRTAERARIDELLTEASQGRSGALVLVGEPGIGKSALCSYAQRCAMGEVLCTRGVESEADLPFAGLSELLAGELHRIGTLPEPQAAALEGALALREVGSVDRFTVGAAVLSLLATAAEGGPVLAIVDDAQWLDSPSAEALLFAARRMRSEGVGLLFATRGAGAVNASRNALARTHVEWA